jgi:GNAT superfamily N-acetyltransferase
VLRDAPRRSGDYRNEEWVVHGTAPATAHELARTRARGRYCISAILGAEEPDGPPRSAYKALGYRLVRTEPLMLHRLVRIPRVAAPARVTIERVRTPAMADRLAKAARSRQILHDELAAGSPIRQYVAIDEAGDLVGWGASIAAGDGARGDGATWCSSMYVEPAHRRRGIARAMLARMLRDDRSAGSTAAVLLATHAGAKLYPVVGYEQVGTLLLLTPPRRPKEDRR